MPNPKISILMLTCGRAAVIGKAIASAIAQNFSEWELIVVDDNSSDRTENIVRELAKKDPRIRYFRRDERGTIANGSNFGLRRAKGKYIAILDDDDYWAIPGKLRKQVQFLDKNPEYVGCGGGAIAVDESGRELFRFLKPEKDEEIKKRALYANPMINSTTLFRRSAAEKIGFYDEALEQFADWDFWLKIGIQGKLYNFPEYFLYYRVWESGSSFKHQRENARAARQIIRRHRRHYSGFAAALVLIYLYSVYTCLPTALKKIFNPFLSRLKKNFISREA